MGGQGNTAAKNKVENLFYEDQWGKSRMKGKRHDDLSTSRDSKNREKLKMAGKRVNRGRHSIP